MLRNEEKNIINVKMFILKDIPFNKNILRLVNRMYKTKTK